MFVSLDTQKKDLPIAKKKKIDESEKSESSSNEEESEEESKHANDNSISTEKRIIFYFCDTLFYF